MEFICDFCDTAVQVTDNQCSNCGALFSDVKCPQCQYKGAAKNFEKGCPKCKYDNTKGGASSLSRNKISSVNFFLLLGAISISLMIMVLYNFI